MLTRLKTLFATVEVRDAGPADDADLRLAAAALLVEAALGDGTFEGQSGRSSGRGSPIPSPSKRMRPAISSPRRRPPSATAISCCLTRG